jgi:hypothetical protein
VIGLRKAFRYLRWVRGLDHGGQAARAIVGDSDINEFAEWQKDHLSLRGRLWLIIVWKYDSENGQPGSEEHRRMNLLEDSLEPILGQDDFATLAIVTTGENLREWTYYAKSDEAFIQGLNLALVGLPVFPIEIHTALDPTWSMYEEFKAGVKETAH